jgi:hypothetical protein
MMPAEMEAKLNELQTTVTMLQQLYAASQDDLRSMAHEYNEAVARLTERAEKAEHEVAKLRMVNVEQLEWIKVLEQRLGSRSAGGGGGAAGGGGSVRSPSSATNTSVALANAGRGGSTAQMLAALQHQQQHQGKQASLRHRLTEFFLKFDPSRVPEVDAVMESFAGRETELEHLLATEPSRMDAT